MKCRVITRLHMASSKKLKYDYQITYDPEKRQVFKAQWRS